MTAVQPDVGARTTATTRWLSSAASGAVEVVWPLFLTLLVTLGGWVLVPVLALGWSSVTIISGSMAPSIQPGHIVVYEPYDGRDIEEGTVVTFRDDRQDRLVTHRVVGINDDGTMRTRGDANAADDTAPLTSDRVIGTGRLVVPVAGLPALWVHEGRFHLLAGFAALTVLAAMPVVRSTGAATRNARWFYRGRHLRRERWRPWAWPLPGRSVAAMAAVVLIGCLATVGLSVAAFGGTNGNGTNSVSAGTLSPPTGLSATGGCQLLLLGPKVDLSWTASTDATGYVVLRSTTSGSGYAEIATTTNTSYMDTAVATNTPYYYMVRATLANWTSADSNEDPATTPLTCV